jgi:FkbH-like protein
MAGSATADARQRRQFYKIAMLREEKQEEFGDDYLGFLASCKITLEILPYSEAEAERVAELVQRTNQLNFSGAKYRREDLEPIVSDVTLEKHVLKCSDRFGSYGTVGFSLVRRTEHELFVEEFMLSCRVQGKFIEQAFFDFLVKTHAGEPPRLVRVNFRQTSRNSPAREVLEKLGFRPTADGSCMVLDLTEVQLDCPFIAVSSPVFSA